MMRKWTAGNKHQTTIILINQVREKIGILWGKKDTTPGGRAIGFFASQRIELRRGAAIKEGKGKDARQIGFEVHALIEKYKTGDNEHKTIIFNYYTRKRSIDHLNEIKILDTIAGLLKRGGSIITMGNKNYSIQEFDEEMNKSPKLRSLFLKEVGKVI